MVSMFFMKTLRESLAKLLSSVMSILSKSGLTFLTCSTTIPYILSRNSVVDKHFLSLSFCRVVDSVAASAFCAVMES